jgi:arylsulfatase A-like enzyme
MSQKKMFGIPKITGHHRPFGIFISYGPDMRKAYNIQNAEIIDIAPTILHIMGTPIPKQSDGEILTTIFNENSELSRKTAQYEEMNERGSERARKEVFSKEQEEEINERLKRLGYL